jgi:hypothetical protein
MLITDWWGWVLAGVVMLGTVTFICDLAINWILRKLEGIRIEIKEVKRNDG